MGRLPVGWPVVLPGPGPGPPARAPFKGPLVRCLSSQNGPDWQAAQLRRPGAVSDLGTWCPQPLGRVLALSNLTFVINLDRNQRSLLPVRLGVTTQATKPLISTTATTQPRVASSSPSCIKEAPVLLLIIVAVYQIWQRVNSNSPGPFSPFVQLNARGGHSDFFSGQLVDFFVADRFC